MVNTITHDLYKVVLTLLKKKISHGTAAIIMKKADLQLSFLLTFLVNVKCNSNLAIALFNFDVFTNYI